MSGLGKRMAALEQAANPEAKELLVCIYPGWCPDLTLEHFRQARAYHNNPVPEGAKLQLVSWRGDENEEPVSYPCGYWDSGGIWAKLCAERGIPHRDNEQ